MDWKSRVRAAFVVPPDEDVIEELAQHAAATYAAARAEGADTPEAERRVDAQIAAWTANQTLLRRRARSAAAVTPPPSQARPLASILQDGRYAWRLLHKQPAYTALVVATMALGIAATTVVGSVAYGVLLKPLPWADAPRLVRLYETREGSTRRFRPMMTNGSYRAWRDGMRTIDAIGAWQTERVAMAGYAGLPRLTITDVTPSLFGLLRATPAAGRLFADGDEKPGAAPVAILSYALWQRTFGGRPDIVGQAVRFDTTTYTIIGVMPASFAFPDRESAAWVPFYVEPVTQPGRDGFSISMFQAIGRLRPGATAAQASAEGTARARTVGNIGVVTMAVFGTNGAANVSATPMLQALTADVRPAILILLVAVVLLLATATANVASLQLARAASRRREQAIRVALGAARGRLVRQALVENLLLGLLGGAAGVALAALMHRALPSLLPAGFPRVDDVALGWRILLFAAAVSMAAGLGCGLLPALQSGRRDLLPALAEDSRAPAGGGVRTRTARVRGAIMVAQVAIACVLLVCASLLTRSFVRLMNADLGYDASNMLTARLVLADGDYKPEQRLALLDEITRRLAATPGVTHAAFSNSLPFTGGEALSSFPVKRRDGSSVQVQTGVRQVSPGYFAAMGQRVVEGHDFTADDANAPEPSAIVNREFSRKYLDGKALGWTLPGAAKPNAPPASGVPRPIVGVVEDTVRRDVTDVPQPEVYYPVSHAPSATSLQRVMASDINLIVRTSSDPRALVPSLRAIVTGAAPNAPLESVMTMQDRVGESLAKPRLYAILLAGFAAFALIIAGVGLFGVLSYSVALRAREIGVRSALGAQMSDIIALVIRQAVVIAVAGLAAGLLASIWLGSALRAFLYGVTSHDAVSFAGVALLLFAVAILASVVPARRAARVDPVSVLRA
jgi:putative ABC transport system permease protein